MKIHKTSIIHKDTIIGENVEIGPYCIIEKMLKLEVIPKFYLMYIL